MRPSVPLALLCVILAGPRCIEKAPRLVGNADDGADATAADAEATVDAGNPDGTSGRDASPPADAHRDGGATPCESTCGDGTCAPACGEDRDGPDACPADCCRCGDGVCAASCGEDRSGDTLCVEDCCRCGDGRCRWEPWCGESGESCWSDCCEPRDAVCGNATLDFDCDEHVAGTSFCFEDACRCGDGVCADGLDGRPQCGESEHTCAADCCRCGDGVCIGTGACGETWDPTTFQGNCLVDCTVCGDGVCAGAENYTTCAVDCCGGCGDGVCRGGECAEDPVTCPQDCGADIACGDGDCDPGEDPELCLADCRHDACGNGTCEPGEDLDGEEPCTADCAAGCGDGVCEGTEDRFGCPLDCGYCGDGYLSLRAGETKDNCPSDFCDDRNPCTTDVWKSEAGVVVACLHTPSDGACDDGDPCTADDACLDGVCRPGEPVVPCASAED